MSDRLSDAEFLENAHTVFRGVLRALSDDAEMFAAFRADEIGFVVHARGVELIEAPDFPARYAGRKLAEEAENYLKGDDE